VFYKNMEFIFFDFETTGIKANGLTTDDTPIELGMILTDENLIFKDRFQTYIKWPWMENFTQWPLQYRESYNIHNINIDTIKKYGNSPQEIIDSIKIFLNTTINKTQYNPTLVSDNAYFDTLMMHKLFNVSGDPQDFYNVFHYTTWDINILYKSANVEKISEHSHDALGDAANMWHRTLRSLQKINYFN